MGQEAGEGRAAGGEGRAQVRWAGVPSMSCRTEGPGGAAPGLQWIRSSHLRLWKEGVSVRPGGKAWGEALWGAGVGPWRGPLWGTGAGSWGAAVGYKCGPTGGSSHWA